jgi:hypothetical protein
MVKYIFALLFVSSFLSAFGQSNQISVYGEYNVPLSKMEWFYKPSGGVQIHYTKLDQGKRWTKGFGFGIGYTEFKPSADTLYYVVDQGGYNGASKGIGVYSPFKIFILSGSVTFDRYLGKKASLSFAGNVGYYYGARDITYIDATGNTGAGELIGWGAFVPRLGFTYFLTNAISVMPYVSYTFMIQLGSTSTDAMNYNPSTGTFMHYYSPGVALNFAF